MFYNNINSLPLRSSRWGRTLRLWLLSSIVAVGLTLSPIAADPLHVVAITDDFASIASAVGGDHIQVKALIKGSKNLHTIQPKPSMILAVRSADLLIRLGMQQDSWIDGLIQVARNNAIFPGQPGYLDASINIKKLDIPTGNIDGSMGDVHKYGNPHYWLNPNNGKIIARQIRDALITLDPDHTQDYTQNTMAFEQEIDKKMVHWSNQLQPLTQTPIITYHKIWPYFFEAFHLTAVGELEPLPGIPPTTKHLATLKQESKKSSVPILVLSANYYPDYVGRTFAKDIHGTFKHLPVNSGEKGITSYIGLFDYLVKELTQ